MTNAPQPRAKRMPGRSGWFLLVPHIRSNPFVKAKGLSGSPYSSVKKSSARILKSASVGFVGRSMLRACHVFNAAGTGVMPIVGSSTVRGLCAAPDAASSHPAEAQAK